MQVLLTIADTNKASKNFLEICSLYPARLASFSELGPQLPANVLVVADFLGATPEHFTVLKTLLAKATCEVIAVLDLKNRQQIMQVRELGCHDLVDRAEPLGTLLLKIREKAADYSLPQIDGKCSPKVGETVKSTCVALSATSTAALTGAALPLASLARTSVEISNTIESDGLGAWLTAVQLHHSHTFCHTMMVTGHTMLFSKVLGLSAETQAMLGMGALVHDLGKIKIPLSILDKPGKLSDAERQLVNKHPAYSRLILKNCKDIPREAAEMAIWHHEFLDGTGYPDGLAADQIPQLVRIITIVDIYSALTEKRAYKDSMSPRQAFATLAEMKGKLDTDLLRAFRDTILSIDLGELRRVAN
ncbi:HD-GYP domain-containing protein [Roseibium sp. LAB1]|jgi:HD-GYP domain-containing protein (c-di-GMP phosphodiesterase class II)